MMSLDAGMIHDCIIYRKTDTGVSDENGQPVYTETFIESKCRFYRKKGTGTSGLVVSSEVQYIVAPYKLFLPPDIDLQKGDRITTTTSGYAGTYKVLDYGPATGYSSTHHMTADIERVE